ncbi:MAG: ATP-binding protein, partial [Planctomycetia bacterium]
MSAEESPSLALVVERDHSRLTIPSRPEWIEETVRFLQQKAVQCGVIDEEQCFKIEIALHEALTNSVIHGNLEIPSSLKEQGDNVFAEALARHLSDPKFASRTVDVQVDYDGRRCQWMFTDQGTGFDVDAVMAKHARQAEIAETVGGAEDDEEPCFDESMLSSGRGILMIKTFMTDVRYDHGGRRIIMTLNRPTQRPV